jgi:hypothetical protein
MGKVSDQRKELIAIAGFISVAQFFQYSEAEEVQWGKIGVIGRMGHPVRESFSTTLVDRREF